MYAHVNNNIMLITSNLIKFITPQWLLGRKKNVRK
jgi:hypothetical protein